VNADGKENGDLSQIERRETRLGRTTGEKPRPVIPVQVRASAMKIECSLFRQQVPLKINLGMRFSGCKKGRQRYGGKDSSQQNGRGKKGQKLIKPGVVMPS